MQTYFYATTKDRKGGQHNYKLPTGETVPYGHEITDLSVAGRFKFSDIISTEARNKLEAAGLIRKSKKNA